MKMGETSAPSHGLGGITRALPGAGPGAEMEKSLDDHRWL